MANIDSAFKLKPLQQEVKDLKSKSVTFKRVRYVIKKQKMLMDEKLLAYYTA